MDSPASRAARLHMDSGRVQLKVQCANDAVRQVKYTFNKIGAFNLRIVTLSMPKTLANLGALWKGTYRDPELLDFYCPSIKIEVTRPSPCQHGGDLEGIFSQLEFRHIPDVIKLLRFI